MAVINLDRLTVAAGGVHTFDVAHTWNILNFTDDDIGAGATLQSSAPDTQATVNFPAGTNNIGNVNGIDIDSSGGGAVVTSGGIDNCENWTGAAAGGGTFASPHIAVGVMI